MLKMTCGIYKITCIVNNKFYIGSSKNIENRWSVHLFNLRSGKHINPHLMNAWEKFGEENFTFEILETIDREQLLLKEQNYLNTLRSWDPEIGFNIRKIAEDNTGFKHSEETKNKISLANKGKKRTPETIKKMKDNHYNCKGALNTKAVLDDEKVLKIINLYKTTQIKRKDLAKMFGITDCSVKNILRGRTWTHITKGEMFYRDENRKPKENLIISQEVENK